ncbi:MAG: T9SS type A sorting domain-containing protein, partial [Bacteroidota bacterium]
AWIVWLNWDSVHLDEHGWKWYREDIITTRYLRLTAQDSLLRLGGLAVCGRGGIPDPYLLTASEVIHSVDSWDRCSLNITHKKIYMPPSADGLFYLYDISGRQVYSGNLKRRIGEVAVFSTYALAAGVYWLRWEENSGTVKSQRIVVGE